MLHQITPLILTYNEAPNIGRTLAKLTWAKEILIVDSFSSDSTLEILKMYPQVRTIQRNFDDHASQWNFGLDQIQTEWVLSLDADYVLTEPVIAEIAGLSVPDQVSAFFANFRYCVGGVELRSSLYPPRSVLFRRNACRFEQDGHTQRLHIRGESRRLQHLILHDDRKPLSDWLRAQDRYAQLEVNKLSRAASSDLSFPDRIRKCLVLAPGLVLLHALIVKRLVLDGWPGWYYAVQRTTAELILTLRLIEHRLDR